MVANNAEAVNLLDYWKARALTAESKVRDLEQFLQTAESLLNKRETMCQELLNIADRIEAEWYAGGKRQ